jgi:hypothetical protein
VRPVVGDSGVGSRPEAASSPRTPPTLAHALNLSSLVLYMRRPTERIVSAFVYRYHGLVWRTDTYSVRIRRLVEETAPSPALFFALRNLT